MTKINEAISSVVLITLLINKFNLENKIFNHLNILL